MGEAADVVRLVFERLNARDIDGFIELCSPRIEWREIPEIPGARTYRGPEEVREWAENLFDVSSEVKLVNWEMQERGNALLMDTSTDMTSSTGMDLGWRAWTVWRVRENLLAYYAGYSDREAAVADFEGEG
jgi:ketosteroid isomerase-like protein